MGARTQNYVDPSLQDRDTVTATASGTTASVAHSSHGYSNSDTVKVYGANEGDYNGEFVISNVSTNAYDYTMSGSPASPATGTLVASKVNIGSGSSGDPWADLQYALDNDPRDSTNGDRFNIKAGTDETLAEKISLSTYGASGVAASDSPRIHHDSRGWGARWYFR